MPRNIPLPRLDGSWEKPGRNPALAAFILVIVLGSIYFMTGNIVSIGIVFARVMEGISSGSGSILNSLGGGSMGKDFMESMKKSYEQNRTWILWFTDICQYLVFFIAGLALSKKWFSSDVAAYSGYKRAPLPGIAAGIAGALLILPVVDAISWVIDAFFPTFVKFNEASAVLYQWGSPAEAIFVFFSISLTPAICEEALFRGVFQRGLQRRLSFPWSFICSGIVFAIFHQSPLATPALIPVGILLGFLYWAFDSIWVGMAMHATYNAIILLLTNKALPLPSFMMNGNYLSWPVWIAGACGIAILCYVVGKKALAQKGKAACDGGIAAQASEAAA